MKAAVLNIALTEDVNGKCIAHRVDCPDVQREREAGKPLMTLFEVECPLPKNVRRHSCLEEE